MATAAFLEMMPEPEDRMIDRFVQMLPLWNLQPSTGRHSPGC